jgi:hypothetical protein
MQSKGILNKISSTVRIIGIIAIVFLFFFIFFPTNKVSAGASGMSTNSPVDPDCPLGVQNMPESSRIVGYKADGVTPIYAECPNPRQASERIIASLVVYLIMIIGLVLTFSIAKSAILMVTAFDNQEQFQTAVKSLVTSVTAVVGVFFSYIIVVFIMVGLLGVGYGGQKNEWDLVCQHRIMFTLTFGNGDGTGRVKCVNDQLINS